MKKTKNNNIEKVKIEPGRVEIRILGIHYVFTYDNNNILRMSKFKPGTQVYDPSELQVPHHLLGNVYSQAIAILKKENQKQPGLKPIFKPKDTKSLQKELFPH